MPKKILRDFAREQKSMYEIGTEIVKRSLKPFPSGQRIAVIKGMTTCPFTAEPAYIIEGKHGQDTTVVAKVCVSLEMLDTINVQ